MVESLRVGDIERIGPDKDALALLGRVLDQNSKIIDANNAIVKALTTPMWLAKPPTSSPTQP
jgi:hypothetical protein